MSVRRLHLVTGLTLALLGSRAAAQEAKPLAAGILQFAADTETRDTIDKDATNDKDGKFIASTNITVRPNTQQGFSIYVLNDTMDDRTMTVQVLDAKGAVMAEGGRTVPLQKFGRMTLTKPKPPAAPAGTAPPVATAPPPMSPTPSVPPPPPGFEVKAGLNKKTKVREFTFRVRVTDDRPKQPLKGERDVLVTILQPENYALPGTPRFSREGTIGLITVEVSANDKLIGPDCVVELQIPRQPTLDPMPREGVYRRTLTAGSKAKLSAKVAIVEKIAAVENGAFYVVVDGVPRTVVYKLDFQAEAEKDMVKQNSSPAIRLVEAGANAPPLGNMFISMPKDKYPVRVEIDPPAEGTLAVRLNRSRTDAFTDADEVITRDSLRHEQVWFDPAGEGGIGLVNVVVRDWVIPLDTRDMRGTYRLQGAIVKGAADVTQFNARLILDDTAPDKIVIDQLPAKHIRGKPLPVRVFASDPESPIVKVAVAFAKLTPEGKLPEGVVLTQAVAPSPEKKSDPWVAQLPVPADKKGGPADIVVLATNAVGLTSVTPLAIELVDPPTGGTITGKVFLGSKAQAGVTVLLKDSDGKDKGSAKTNDKGVYEFLDVASGGYHVSAAKADSGIGTKGDAPVRVRVGEKSEADIHLTRRP